MADLAQEFFTRDLSPQEEEALGLELKSSEELAFRFAGLAAQDYAKLGLALPSLPRAFPGLKALLLIPALGLAGALGWWLSSSKPESGPSPSYYEEKSADLEKGKAPASQGASSSSGFKALKGASKKSGLVVEMAGSGRFRLKASGMEGAQARILDSRGRQVRRLNPMDGEGNRWLWDGLLASGEPAGPGRYELRVEGAGRKLSKWVEIEKRVNWREYP